MKHRSFHGARFFFATAPMPCPYLPGRIERRIVTELVGRNASKFHDQLTFAGFRRSHSIAYAPACPTCNECVAVRILADEFKPSRTQRRILNLNNDIHAAVRPPEASEEQYALFARYQKTRHGTGDMAKMSFLDYQALVEETPVDSEIVEFFDSKQRLIAACLVDKIENGLSAVYSYFEPELNQRSLGTYMILWLIREALDQGLAHVYLGFWVADCSKMSYKAKFKPIEAYTPSGWKIVEFDDTQSTSETD